MPQAYRILGGIGYIFMAVPFLDLVGYILASIAWVMAGRERKIGLFTALGILMLIGLIASLISIFAMPWIMLGMMGAELTEIASRIMEMIGLIIAVLAILVVVYIFQVLGFFRAAREFGVGLFKAVGILCIILSMLGVITIISIAFLPAFLLMMAMVGILGFITCILAGVSFFLIKG